MVKEVAIASEWDKAILPVYLEPVQVPDTLHYQLAGIQHVEYYAGREKEAFEGMIASLNRIGVNTGSTDDANAASPAESRTPRRRTTNIGQEPARDLVVARWQCLGWHWRCF